MKRIPRLSPADNPLRQLRDQVCETLFDAAVPSKGKRQTARPHHDRALVTGATSGIGEAFVTALAQSTDLLLTGRNEAKLAALQDRFRDSDRTVETVAADLATLEGMDRIADAAEAFGIDLLVNNAGVGQLGRHLDHDPTAVRETVMVNVVAVADLTRRLLPSMMARAYEYKQRAGVIIVSSTAAFLPIPHFATYAATKAFDLHYAEAIAEELRDDPVDILALCPGATKTEFNNRAGARWQAFPLASDPEAVAREALQTLGRETILVTGLLDRGTFGLAARPRPSLTRAIGNGMRFLTSSD